MKKAGDYSQVILYAKGWFEKNDLFDDLKTLVAEAFLLPKDGISDCELRNSILTIADEFGCMDKGHKFNEFMDNISPENFYRYTENWSISQMGVPHPDYDYNVAVIRSCLSAMSRIKVIEKGRRVVLLRKPDFSILPRDTKSKSNLDDYTWDEEAA